MDSKMDNKIDSKINYEYYKNGNIKKKSYKYLLPEYNNTEYVLHSINNETPAIIEYYESGNKKVEHYIDYYYKYHRSKDKPAYIEYYQNGLIKMKSYYYYGSNRSCKPSYEYFDELGNKILTIYYVLCGNLKKNIYHSQKGKDLKNKIYGKKQNIFQLLREMNIKGGNNKIGFVN